MANQKIPLGIIFICLATVVPFVYFFIPKPTLDYPRLFLAVLPIIFSAGIIFHKNFARIALMLVFCILTFYLIIDSLIYTSKINFYDYIQYQYSELLVIGFLIWTIFYLNQPSVKKWVNK